MSTLCAIICNTRLYLIWIMKQWTIVTLVPNTIHVCVFLVSVVHKGAVVILIENFWNKKFKLLYFIAHTQLVAP